MTAPVVRSASVDRNIDDTFRIFTTEIGAWWPLPTHGIFGDASGGVAFDDDRLVERSVTGEENVWAEVTAWDPPNQLCLDWHPGRNSDEATTVEVTFEAIEGGTRVIIEHRGWERLGPDAIERRRQYMRPNAWGGVIDHFADATASSLDHLDALRTEQERFLDAATAALSADLPAPADEWCGREVVAHVTLNDMAMIRVCHALVHGEPPRFANEAAQSPDALGRWISTSRDDAHLIERARSTATQLRTALARLSAEQLDTLVPCLLTDHGNVMLDDERPWKAIAIDVQTGMHLPSHFEQLTVLSSAAD